MKCRIIAFGAENCASVDKIYKITAQLLSLQLHSFVELHTKNFALVPKISVRLYFAIFKGIAVQGAASVSILNFDAFYIFLQSAIIF